MSIVAGVDFGTLSVRVSLFDSARAAGVGGRRVSADPQTGRPGLRHATHADHMRALAEARARR